MKTKYQLVFREAISRISTTYSSFQFFISGTAPVPFTATWQTSDDNEEIIIPTGGGPVSSPFCAGRPCVKNG